VWTQEAAVSFLYSSKMLPFSVLFTWDDFKFASPSSDHNETIFGGGRLRGELKTMNVEF
jgi:hypothetical protein